MIHFIANHWVAAIVVAVAISFVAGMFAYVMCGAAAYHDEPNLIEPGDLGELPTTSDVTVELKRRGFRVAFWDEHGLERMEITDADAITFYMTKDCTLEQCLKRHQEKRRQFQAA